MLYFLQVGDRDWHTLKLRLNSYSVLTDHLWWASRTIDSAKDWIQIGCRQSKCSACCIFSLAPRHLCFIDLHMSALSTSFLITMHGKHSCTRLEISKRGTGVYVVHLKNILFLCSYLSPRFKLCIAIIENIFLSMRIPCFSAVYQ